MKFTPRLINSKALLLLCLISGLNLLSYQAIAINTEEPEIQSSHQAYYTHIQHSKLEIEGLEEKITHQPEDEQFLLRRRLIKLQIRLMEKEVKYVENYLRTSSSASTESNAAELANAQASLKTHRGLVEKIHKQLGIGIRLPVANMDIAEEMSIYNQIFSMKDNSDKVYALYIQSIKLARQLELDVSSEEQHLSRLLSDVAANNAVILEYNIDSLIDYKSSLKAIPDDTDLKGRLSLTDQRIKLLAVSLQATIDLMTQLHMDTVSYQELVISASGQLTTEIFDSSVINRIFKEWGDKFTVIIIDDSPDILLKFVIFFVIILISKKVSKVSESLLVSAMNRPGTKISSLLRRMLASIANKGILALGVLIALSQIGFSLAPLLAGLGVAGFIIGFAMQDTLSNFASGMMILIYRPFDEGDMIEAGGVYGCVNKMNLVSTTILTLDNQTIMVPNNKIWGDVIKNFTHQKTRRVDLLFGISYGDNIIQAEEIIWSILNADDRILKSPLPLVKINELGDSSVNIAVRPWTKTDNYWDLHWDIIRTVKLRFDEEGISIPFPQRDLHLKTQEPIYVKIANDE